MKRIVSIVLIVMICLCMCACSSSDDTQTEVKETETEENDDITEEDESGDAMPEFVTTDLDGNEVTNEVFSKADLTVVNFWATYCGPCIDEMPELAKWQEVLPENVQIIGIVVDTKTEDSEEVTLAQQIVEKTGVKYQNLIATGEFDDMISELIGVPTTYFVDSEGRFYGDPVVGADVDGYKEVVENYLATAETP